MAGPGLALAAGFSVGFSAGIDEGSPLIRSLNPSLLCGRRQPHFEAQGQEANNTILLIFLSRAGVRGQHNRECRGLKTPTNVGFENRIHGFIARKRALQ